MHLKANGDESMMNELQELFMTADLVKFAKYSSLLNEKDMNLVNAINFIDKTKRDDVPTEEKIMPTLSDDGFLPVFGEMSMQGVRAAAIKNLQK